jgi:hypothetical protein
MNFIFRLLVFSVISLLLSYSINFFFPQGFKTEQWYLAAIFFTLFGLISLPFISTSIDDPKKNKFVFRFMGMTSLKLFLSLLIIVVFRFTFPENFKGAAIHFLFQYFCFTGFEVFILLRELRKPSRIK